jgi:putative SOS response-associated peptidase YedK
MCGRFVIQLNPRDAATFGVSLVEPWGPRFNVAPTQLVPVVVERDGARELRPMVWGLVPSWASDPASGNRMINARAETVATKPAFRWAFKLRRCLILASSFYEWQEVPGAKKRQPHVIGLASGEPFAFAGLYETWQPPEGGEAVETCTIITCAANAVMAEVRHRMPVILPPETHDRWLGSESPLDDLQTLLVPYPGEGMRTYPVTTRVNNPRYDDQLCLTPALGTHTM